MKQAVLQRCRRWSVLAVCMVMLGGLAACSDRPAFVGIDVTGANFGQGFDLTDQWGERRTLTDFQGQFDTQGRLRLYHRYNTGPAGLASDGRRLLAKPKR